MADYTVREERSNAGATALATDFLTNVFGLTSSLANRVMDTIETGGEMPALRQSIKLLPISSHTKLNQLIGDGEVNGVEDTPFTDEDLGNEPAEDLDTMDQPDVREPTDSGMHSDSDDMHDSDSILDDMGADSGDLRNNADADDFDPEDRKDSYKESFTSFKGFLENAQLDAKLDSQISSNMDSGMDERTLKKIKNLEAKGQKDAANQIRKQAKRQNNKSGTMSPTERRVLAKKKELARAIQADKEAQVKQEGNV